MKDDQVKRWALFVKNNPDKWKSQMTSFTNAQITKANEFYEELAKTGKGREKIRKLRENR